MTGTDTKTAVTPVTVTFVDEAKEIKAMPGSSLRTLAMNAGVELYGVHIGPLPGELFNCRGMGFCGTCLVEVVEGMGNLSPEAPNGKESMSIGNSPMGNFRASHWKLDNPRSKYRLACQVKVMGDVKLKTVKDTLDFSFDD